MRRLCGHYKSCALYMLLLWMMLVPLCLQGQSGNTRDAPPSGNPGAHTDTVEHFDLVLFGDHLQADSLVLSLKTNPAYGSQWEEIEAEPASDSGKGRWLAFRDLPMKRYFGQDIRENYLALKITHRLADPLADPLAVPLAVSDLPGLRAVYAVNADGKMAGWSWSQWIRAIRQDPGALKAHSLARHVRPRPLRLTGKSQRTLHIEAGVMHLKPGVQEVKWLDILFR